MCLKFYKKGESVMFFAITATKVSDGWLQRKTICVAEASGEEALAHKLCLTVAKTFAEARGITLSVEPVPKIEDANALKILLNSPL